MMHALGVPRDLGADHAGGVAIVLGAADATDRVPAEDLDLKRAGRRTVVRAGRSKDLGAKSLIHCNSNLPRLRGAEQSVTRQSENVHSVATTAANRSARR